MRSLLAAAAFVLAASSAQAQAAPQTADDGVAGHFQLRLRGVAVLPDATATIKVGGVDIGGRTEVTDSFIPEIDGTYFVTDHVGLELIAGTTQHSVHSSVAGNVGSVWLLPPTLTVQYHFDPASTVWRPYVGAGVNYTFFYSPRSTLPNLHFSDGFGWALQAGADVPVGNGPYFLNLDVKKIFLDTHARALSGVVRADATLDPWLIGAGVGIRF
jgi:outer membrane protein